MRKAFGLVQVQFDSHSFAIYGWGISTADKNRITDTSHIFFPHTPCWRLYAFRG
jgi:hypothetical protein